MSNIAGLLPFVQNRLEETVGADGFWVQNYELAPLIAEAMFEATLITGEPEVLVSSFAVTQNQTIQSMPNTIGGATGIAAGIVRVLDANGVPLKRYSMDDLDAEDFGWDDDTGTVPTKWFPFGLNNWGIYPQLTVPYNVTVYYVACPICAPRAVLTAPTIPFQVEYNDTLCDYAAGHARLKEATQEFYEGLHQYDAFLKRMQDFSKFAERKTVLRFTTNYGPKARPMETEVR